MTPRPPAEMSDDELRAELDGLSRLCVAALERGAILYAEAVRRGLAVVIRSVALRGLLPAIADHTLSAKAVVRFSDLGRLFRAVRALPLAEQNRLADGGAVDVSVNGDVLPLTARELWPCFVKQVFHTPGRVATVEEQERFLAAQTAIREAKERRAAERAVKRLEAEQVSTVGQAVERLIAAGWRVGGS